MSAALSAAKKRRAPASVQPETPRINTANGGMKAGGTSVDTQGLTLPQVISLIDKRLIQLELFTKNIHSKHKSTDESSSSTTAQVSNTTKEEITQAVIEEFNTRFEIMAEEIAELKNVVLGLQSFTMDVNKTLLQQLQTNGVTTMPLFEFSKNLQDDAESDSNNVEDV